MQNNEPLNIALDLSNIKTAVPLIADGHMARVHLHEVTQGEREGNPTLKWEFRLNDPAPTSDGGQVQVGFPLFTNFDLSQDWMKQKMARFVDGLLGTGDADNKKGKPTRPLITGEQINKMIGMESIAKIVIQRSKKSDYVGNDIQSLTYPADLSV